MRLQKVLSEAGIASRRQVEILIRKGRVLVNERKAVLGQRIDPRRDKVMVNGQRVQLDPARRYLMLNKPDGVVTTASDPQGRTTVLDIVGVHERVFPVGRLDIGTEGLLLLTNDGELTYRLTHPRYEVPKIYVAEVTGLVGRATVRKLTETGVDLDGRPFTADSLRVLASRHGSGGRSLVELTLHEGPKHVVRRLLEAVELPLIRLVRTGMGPLRLGRLSTGSYRNLAREEVEALYREVGL